MKFWSTMLPSQEFTVDTVPSAIHREKSRDRCRRESEAAYKYWTQEQCLRLGGDQFYEYANSVSEIARSYLAL